MKKLYILGLVLLTLITSGYATYYSGITVTTDVSNTSLVFDTTLQTNNLTITNDSILIYDFLIDGCLNVVPFYNFTGNDTVYYTSNLAVSDNCVGQQVDNDVSSIIVLGIVLSILIMFITATVSSQYLIYVVWIFIATIMLICVDLLFNVF